MKKDGISIIIPCYNVEKYLDKCINSILEQELKQFEIILVEDCSSDNTKKIVEKYVKKYDNITAIYNKVNSGAGYSRNIALKQAQYDIISFIDSDDYVEKDFYQKMLSTMKKEKADVVVCDIYVKYPADDFEESDYISYACQGPVEKYNFINNGLAASPCNKLMKKELLLDNLFPEGMMNEDVATILAILVKCKKVAYEKETYYNYIQRKNSVQNESISLKRFDIFKSLDLLFERIDGCKDYDKYVESIIYQQVIMFFMYVIPKEKDFFRRKKLFKLFHEYAHKYNIRQNHMLWIFLEEQGSKHKYYYRLLLKLNCTGLQFLDSLMVAFYDWYKNHIVKPIIKEEITMQDLIIEAKKQAKKKNNKYKISVVIPNYNYREFLFQRLYCILNQTKKIDELIILDDCSKDNSRLLIDKVYDELKDIINIKKVYNVKNSGSAFKQWEKGFKLASGDYVWIAEADDYCRSNFLTKVMKPIEKNDNVVISYSDTAYIDKEGKLVLRTIKPEIDILKTGHWDKSFVVNGIDEIKNHAYLNCTIANVSSVIFKKDNYDSFFKLSGQYKQAGDWLFYVNIMTKGKVAFYNKPLNYYRLHGNNVTSVTKKQAQFDEIVKVHKYLDDNFKLNKEQKEKIKDRYEFLRRVWNLYE